MTIYNPDALLSQFGTSYCSKSSFNCCFLTCIQISQEAGRVTWCFHLFKDFPQFVVIHTGKNFSVVNEAEVDVFLKFSCFFYDPLDLAVWSLVPLPFLNPTWRSGSSWFTYCWSLAWRILSSTLLACEMSAVVWLFEHYLALPFFGIGMKTDLFWFSFAGKLCSYCLEILNTFWTRRLPLSFWCWAHKLHVQSWMQPQHSQPGTPRKAVLMWKGESQYMVLL